MHHQRRRESLPIHTATCRRTSSPRAKRVQLGWSGGGLDDYDFGKCIGGDRFGNNEGLLPESNGRKYYECDIYTLHEDDRAQKAYRIFQRRIDLLHG
ncbi:MAG: ribonuclease domain-containing protein [Eubacteriales bacterium]